MRSHYCGQVNEKLVGQEVTVAGWVHRRRDHGGVIFVDVRDREGLLQVVFYPDNQAQFNEAEKLRNEFIAAPDKEIRMAALEKLRKRLWEVVPYVMTGQYDQPYAWRKNVSGVLPTSKLVLFNIEKN